MTSAHPQGAPWGRASALGTYPLIGGQALLFRGSDGARDEAHGNTAFVRAALQAATALRKSCSGVKAISTTHYS
jgi:hypothetical protein